MRPYPSVPRMMSSVANPSPSTGAVDSLTTMYPAGRKNGSAGWDADPKAYNQK